MGFFSRLFRLGSAGANEALSKLESGREVELTRQDLKALQKDESKVLEGLAEIKASIVSLERDIQAAKTRKDSYENNAMALLNKDPEDKEGLAQQNAIEAEKADEQIRALNEQLIQQTKLEMDTRQNLRTIQEALRAADNDLRLMQSMTAAKRSADKARAGLAGVGQSNALQRIQERKKKLTVDLDKSKMMQELSRENSSQNLDNATRKALDSGGGGKKLEELKKRLAAPK